MDNLQMYDDNELVRIIIPTNDTERELIKRLDDSIELIADLQPLFDDNGIDMDSDSLATHFENYDNLSVEIDNLESDISDLSVELFNAYSNMSDFIERLIDDLTGNGEVSLVDLINKKKYYDDKAKE